MYRTDSETLAFSLGSVTYLHVLRICKVFCISNIYNTQYIYYMTYRQVYGIYCNSGYIVILHQV